MGDDAGCALYSAGFGLWPVGQDGAEGRRWRSLERLGRGVAQVWCDAVRLSEVLGPDIEVMGG